LKRAATARDAGFSRLKPLIVSNRKKFAVLTLLLFIPAIYSQSHAAVYYKLDEALPQDMPSIVATQMLKDEYNMASTHFIIVDSGLSGTKMVGLSDKIKAVNGVKTVISYNALVSPEIPDFFVPQSIKDLFRQDGKQLSWSIPASRPPPAKHPRSLSRSPRLRSPMIPAPALPERRRLPTT
jgi:hypothetical protein